MGDPDDWDLYANLAISEWIKSEEYAKLQSYGFTAQSYKHLDQNSWGGDFNFSGCGVYCTEYDPQDLIMAKLAGVNFPSGKTTNVN